MKKEILTIGYEIPGFSDSNKHFGSNTSFMDADIIVISPEVLCPSTYGWVNFTSGGGGCYDVATSKKYTEKIKHLSKEVDGALKMGKNVFILLSEKENYSLATDVTSPRKGQSAFTTTTKTNYDFLPIKIGNITSAAGKHISFSGERIFSEFHKTFKNNMEYRIYLENPEPTQTLFTGKDKTKILGAIHEVGDGRIITLPYISYDEDKFQGYNEDEGKNYWTDEAMKFGRSLTSCLMNIDKQLKQKSEKTPAPEWAKRQEFTFKKVTAIQRIIDDNEQKIETLKAENEELNVQLKEENILRDLLFENGKPLEYAVIKALHILGYQAENYDDGVLELDQIIMSPESHRFIGECEGKDYKDINITKFRQLVESLNADFAREEVDEKAYGILFGNPQRLEDPDNRKLDFTKKCKVGAERERVALVNTTELFKVAKYLEENRNSKFKKACRDAIYEGLGKVVEFPSLP